MLTLICGPDRVANSDTLLERIRTQAESGRRGMILIVPEQYSHETERLLCQACGDTISRSAEVLSFTRLASRVFSIYGGVCGEYLDGSGRLLTLYLAAQQVREQLKFYASAMTRPDFLKQLGALMEELMTGCVTPEDLHAAADRLSGRLAQKVLELSILYESYLAVCKNGRSDPVTRQTRLLELLTEESYMDGRAVFFDGFSDFTPLQWKLVETILAGAADVTAAFVTDGSGGPAFQTGQDTARRMRLCAQKLQIPVQIIRTESSPRRAPQLQAWLAGLFCGGAPAPDARGHVQLFAASSVRQECELAARLVRSHAAQGGRFRDITVCVTDPDAYFPYLRELFARSRMPAYFAVTAGIAGNAVIRALLAALQAVRHYELLPVLSYLKSPLCSLSPDACDRLERYCTYWSVHALAWERPWQMHPRGLGLEMEPEDEAALAQLNAWREEAVAPLQALRLGLAGADTVGTQVRALAQFMEQTQLRERMQQDALRNEQAGETQRAQQCRQIYEVLTAILEQMYAVLGSVSLEPELFTQVFAMLIHEAHVGTIPAACDEIQVTTLPMLRHRITGTLIVLGAEDGRFPAFPDQSGLLAERERSELRAVGLELSPEQEACMDRELGWVLAALSAPMERAALVCSSAQPSYLYQKTQAFLVLDAPEAGDLPFYADADACAGACLQQPSMPQQIPPVVAQACAQVRTRSAFVPEDLTAGTVHALYGKTLELSASKIDRFASCRYAYFLQYGLRAKPWKQAEFDASLFGTFVHQVLQFTVNDVMAQGGFHAVSDEAVDAIAARHMRAYLDNELRHLAGQGRREEYLSQRNLQEAAAIVRDVANELRCSDFRPIETELAFDRSGQSLAPIEYRASRGVGRLTGIVDRVDAYDTEHARYYRVVDYKTGKKDFDFSEILCGENLQMLLYLSALRQLKPSDDPRPFIPAGVLYVPGRYSMIQLDAGEDPAAARKERSKQLRRKGVILRDEPVLGAMEHFDDQPQYMPYTCKKNGPSGNLVNADQLAGLERFVNESVCAMIDELLSGAVRQNPIVRGAASSACRFCDFRTACHKDAWKIAQRNRKRVSADEFWRQIEGGRHDG